MSETLTRRPVLVVAVLLLLLLLLTAAVLALSAWRAQQITLRHDGVVETRELAAGTLDQSAFHFSFMFAPPSEAGLAVTLSDGRRVKDYRYRFVGSETLATAIGSIEALHFARDLAAGDERAFDVWLAPAQHHLPVRIRYVEGNAVFNSRIIGIEIR